MESNQQPDPELETFDLTEPSTVSNSFNKLVDSPKSDSVDIENGQVLDVIEPLSRESSPASEKVKNEEAKETHISKGILQISEPTGHKPGRSGLIPNPVAEKPAKSAEEQKIQNPDIVAFDPEADRAGQDMNAPQETSKYLAKMQPGTKILTRLDVSTMKRENFKLGMPETYKGDGIFICLPDNKIFICAARFYENSDALTPKTFIYDCDTQILNYRQDMPNIVSDVMGSFTANSIYVLGYSASNYLVTQVHNLNNNTWRTIRNGQGYNRIKNGHICRYKDNLYITGSQCQILEFNTLSEQYRKLYGVYTGVSPTIMACNENGLTLITSTEEVITHSSQGIKVEGTTPLLPDLEKYSTEYNGHVYWWSCDGELLVSFNTQTKKAQTFKFKNKNSLKDSSEMKQAKEPLKEIKLSAKTSCCTLM